MGGLLTLPSFTKIFPQIDTTQAAIANLTKSQYIRKATIQGADPPRDISFRIS